jgi:hypothetical protein
MELPGLQSPQMTCMLRTGVHIVESDVDCPHLPAYTVAVQLLVLLVLASRWRVASVLHGVELGTVKRYTGGTQVLTGWC